VGRAFALRRETVQPAVPVQHPVVQEQDGAGQRTQLRTRQTAQVRRPTRVHFPNGAGRLQSRRHPAVLRYKNGGGRRQEDRGRK